MTMNRRSPPPKPQKLVWRMTERAPHGEWVDPATSTHPSKKDLPEVSSGGWVVSTFDLLSGTDVSESPDTVPDELFDELFRPPPAPPKAPPK